MILKQGTGVFKVRQPKKFNLSTRYYDVDKERLDQRINEIEQKHGKEEGDRAKREINFRAQTNLDWKKSQVQKARMRSNIRLLIILVVLTAVFIYLFTNVDAVSSLFQKNAGK
ncbi:MAG: hypothetical protein ACI9J3_000472 [Parvicellaceae bacterium]|jgi:hypothetical protein